VLAEISARRNELASQALPLVHGFRRRPEVIADNWVDDIAQQLRTAKHHQAYDEARIKDFAENYSVACVQLAAPRPTEPSVLVGFRRLKKQPRDKWRVLTLFEKLEACRAFGAGVGIDAPKAQGLTPAGELARWCDGMWWRRQLRKAWTRKSEDALREMGVIRRGKQAYASDAAVEHRAARIERTREWLKSREMQNEAGEALDLLKLHDSSVASPKLRRGEFMCRVRGFEELADSLGHVALFFTLTTPSRFHAQHSKGGVNEKWKDERARVRDGQKWLTGMWARARAKVARLGVLAYGVRVAEPHHDGTPHWHALLFTRPGDAARLRQVLHDFWLSDDGGEDGAELRRYKCDLIDRAKGSAVGYVAKYVSKNIDAAGSIGDDVSDETGKKVSDGVSRVAAWASVHGIRQFQQIGGPPVGLWRELRRVREPVAPVLVESVRACADAGKWHDFIEALGGIERACRRVSSVAHTYRRAVRVPSVRYRGGPRGGWRRRPANADEMPALWMDKKEATALDAGGRGEVVGFTRYGEKGGQRPAGVCSYGLLGRFVVVETRRERWKIERKQTQDDSMRCDRTEGSRVPPALSRPLSVSFPALGSRSALGPVAITVLSRNEPVPSAAEMVAALKARADWVPFNPVTYQWPDHIPKMHHEGVRKDGRKDGAESAARILEGEPGAGGAVASAGHSFLVAVGLGSGAVRGGWGGVRDSGSYARASGR
jgi:hypothetical protein